MNNELKEYRNGFGQGKSHCIDRVNELLAEIEDALHNPDPRFCKLPDGEPKKKLLTQRETLRWLRMVLKKTVICPR